MKRREPCRHTATALGHTQTGGGASVLEHTFPRIPQENPEESETTGVKFQTNTYM